MVPLKTYKIENIGGQRKRAEGTTTYSSKRKRLDPRAPTCLLWREGQASGGTTKLRSRSTFKKADSLLQPKETES